MPSKSAQKDNRYAARCGDLPSVLFLFVIAANTFLIALTPHAWRLYMLLALPQALLLAGCQEAKHMAVHGTFLSLRRANDIVGVICAALFGVNFVAYRYFHLQHHRATCTDIDPEGRLYSLSWRTRWIWALAPLELPWVAWHQNRVGWPMVPEDRRNGRNAALFWMVVCGALIGAGVWHGGTARHVIIWAYAIPLALLAWFDFLLTQAEHYGVAIVPASPGKVRRDPQSITMDIVLPFGLGWLMLNRSLHSVHHRYPALRWYDAPRILRADPTAAPTTYWAFARRWLIAGPRLWQHDEYLQAEPVIVPGNGRAALEQFLEWVKCRKLPDSR
ncbi:fatty acid desaturase family protein [Robbsia andropogonis]|uniref:fatty acid desaturase family protein n=1 Tax=Robbsia andropogonis TaxID=28092 RepID=UPI0004653CFF|nr:fatty acid desaturase [Robbsia andropogonis]MCP1118005.1 fatty acid desaturase [Robbsia andropogonis]MCP1127714.1 fatty acid desaturase [Robbsia andropogonis]